MKTMMIRCRGVVQGVFFRKSTQDTARLLGIKGWVKNEPNGDVLIKASGESKNMDEFVQWCHKGPIHARVEEVLIKDIVFEEFDSFEIAY